MAESTKKKSTSKANTAVTDKTAVESAQTSDMMVEKVAEATGAKLYDEADVQTMIAQAVAKAMAQMQPQTPQVVQIATDVERVQFLFMAEVADDNVYEVGPNGMYGRIVGKTGAFTVPKSDLSRVMDSMFRLMLKKRWIIAVSGLTEEEREAYGVDYKDGEVLDKRAFTRIVELGDAILDIYPQLCRGHREMVAKRYYEAYMQGHRAVKRETVVALNGMSREKDGGDGAFVKIIEAMNESDAHR